MIQAVIFDLDDTLYLESDFVYSGLRAVDEYLKSKKVFGFYEIASKLFQKGFRGRIFNHTLDILNINYDESDIISLLDVYRGHNPQISLSQDAKWVINWIKNHFIIGLITDGFLRTQQNKVKALQIKKEFNLIIYSDEFGSVNWKPSEVPYLKVMEHLKLEGKNLVYIGDNIQKDFITAKKLGWLTIQIEREQGEYTNLQMNSDYRAHYKISSLYELTGILQIL